jgi:hypothetical protein
MAAHGDDPLEGWTLDDDFVRSAAQREPSAADRSRAARAAEIVERSQRRAARRRRRRSRARATAVLAVLVGLGVMLVRFGDGGDGGSPRTFDSGALARDIGFAVDRPSPSPAVSDVPLGKAPDPPADDRYEFVATLPDGGPVTYDPCRPIPIVVNDLIAPRDDDELLEEALDAISDASGLQFEVEGTTDEAPSADRPPFDRARYGDRWAPVLVAWTEPDDVPELDGDVAGIGGSAWTSVGGADDLAFVSGLVALDGPQLADLLAGPDGRAIVRSVIVHELAHLVGLDHVDAPDQLMFDRPDATELQPGDLAGLARLGRGRCFPQL